MPRKTKIGLDYFPHSCNLDDELEYIIAVHKEQGYYIYFRLLERIYKHLGYYINWDKKNIALFSNSINVDINKINDTINDCLSEHLFNKSIHKKHNILTSKGIQERYFEAIDRRKEAEIIKEYIILKNVYINKLKVNIIWLNVNKSTQSKVEYSKVKERKYIKTEFLPIFNRWLIYKRDKKQSYKNEDSIEMAYNKLYDLANGNFENAVKLVEQSLANNWAGLFPLKEDEKKSSGKYRDKSDDYSEQYPSIKK